MKATLQKESKEHDALCVAVHIMDWVHDIARGALRFGVNLSFAIARCPYENIDLATMSQGFAPMYTDAELEDIEKEVAPLARDLSNKIEDEIIPLRN